MSFSAWLQHRRRRRPNFYSLRLTTKHNRALPLSERYLEAQIAQNQADMELYKEQVNDAEVEVAALARASGKSVALAAAPVMVPRSHKRSKEGTASSVPDLAAVAPGIGDTVSVSTLNQAIQGFQMAGTKQEQELSSSLKAKYESYEPPVTNTQNGPSSRGGDSASRTRTPTTIPTTRTAYLRKAASYSPSRSRDARSRRQRLRAEALERSTELVTGDTPSLRSSKSKSVLSRKEQIARDNARSYYLHEQQIKDLEAGVFNPEPNPLLPQGEDLKDLGSARVRLHPTTAIPIAAGGLNTSFNTDISGISDTMITYEGQPAKTRFLTPILSAFPTRNQLPKCRFKTETEACMERGCGCPIEHPYLQVYR